MPLHPRKRMDDVLDGADAWDKMQKTAGTSVCMTESVLYSHRPFVRVVLLVVSDVAFRSEMPYVLRRARLFLSDSNPFCRRANDDILSMYEVLAHVERLRLRL